MATTITDGTNYLIITRGGVKDITIPKNNTVLRVSGSNLKIEHNGQYSTTIAFSDVSSPSTANIEALRVAVKNILIA